jgi:predicted dehydrogenase
MNLKPVKIAAIGSGRISYTYLNTLTSGFSIIDLVGCSDLVPEKSKARSGLFGIKQLTTEQILSDPEIEIVLNLTEIDNHAKVSRMILESGKHCYSEKSAGCGYEEARAIVDLASSKNLRFGCAPDIYMGAAYQTARKLIDDGWIGDPVIALSWVIRSRKGQQREEPIDAGAYRIKSGTTITYDMGGYYMNALVSLLGPVNRVSGFARPFEKYTYENTRNPEFGKPAFVPGMGANIFMASLEFENGCYGSFAVTSESFGKEIPRVEIYGTKGNLTIPDPNCFGGYNGHDLYLTRIGSDEPYKMPFSHAFNETDPDVQPKSGRPEPCHNSWRGIAVVDMAYAIRQNRPHRSSADLALHFVEIMSAIEDSSRNNPAVYTVKSRPARPAPLSPGCFGPVEVMEGSINNI